MFSCSYSFFVLVLLCSLTADGYPTTFILGEHDRENDKEASYESDSEGFIQESQPISNEQNVIEMTRLFRSSNQVESNTCGIRPEPDYLSTNNIPFGSVRIVGGSSAIQRWPWQVLLVDKGDMRPFCGGVLIGTQHVLTAAHCFDNHDRDTVDVILGEHDRSVNEGTEQIYSIECLYIHKRYVANAPYHHDIALIKLGREEHQFRTTENILPVCLPTKSEFKENDLCIITGWGYTSVEALFGRELPNIVQQARVPLINLRTCQTAYGTQITKYMQCAGYLEGSHRADTCKADSGGPLVCQDESGKFKLWGITSWGDNLFCQLFPSEPVPGVYTRVDRYLKWINNKLTSTKCK